MSFVNQIKSHKPNVAKSLLINVKAFTRAAKEESPFAIYATPIFDGGKTSNGIPS